MNPENLANSTVAAAALLLGKAFLALGLLIAFSSPLYGFDLSSNNMCYETDFNPEVKKSKYPIKMNCWKKFFQLSMRKAFLYAL